MKEALTENQSVFAWAKQLREWADHPASSGFVPIGPATLQKIAEVLEDTATGCPRCLELARLLARELVPDTKGTADAKRAIAEALDTCWTHGDHQRCYRVRCNLGKRCVVLEEMP